MKWIQDNIRGTCQLNVGEHNVTLEMLMSEVGSVIPGGVRRLRRYDTHGHTFGVVPSDTYLQQAAFEVVATYLDTGAVVPPNLRTCFDLDRCLQVSVYREDEKISERNGISEPFVWASPDITFLSTPLVRAGQRISVRAHPQIPLPRSQDRMTYAELMVKIDVVRRVE